MKTKIFHLDLVIFAQKIPKCLSDFKLVTIAWIKLVQVKDACWVANSNEVSIFWGVKAWRVVALINNIGFGFYRVYFQYETFATEHISQKILVRLTIWVFSGPFTWSKGWFGPFVFRPNLLLRYSIGCGCIRQLGLPQFKNIVDSWSATCNKIPLNS